MKSRGHQGEAPLVRKSRSHLACGAAEKQAATLMQALTVLTHSAQHAQTKNLLTGETYAKTKRIVSTYTLEFRTLKKLKKHLQLLAAETSSCVIRGALKPNAPLPLRRRLTHFDDAPQSWVMLDIDSIELPKHLRTTPYTKDHIYYAIAQLPDEFQSVDCVWQASASAGVSRSKLKLHLWFLLSVPLTSAQLRAWLGRCTAIDPSTLRAVQPHYTAAPIGAEGTYSGVRVARLRGALRRVVVPEIGAVETLSHVVDMPARPSGAANVSRETIASAHSVSQKRAEQALADCSIAYATAYEIGTILGPSVALETWNDAEHGHETWRDACEDVARAWGLRVAAVPGARHGEELYVQRVAQGIEWGVAQERARRCEQSQKVLDAQVTATKELRAKLLRKLGLNAGSDAVLQQVGKQLGRYATHVDKDKLVAMMAAESGFSEQQCSDALVIDESNQIDAAAWRADLAMTGRHADEIVACDSNLLAIFQRYPEFMNSFRFNVRTKQLEVKLENPIGLPAGNVNFESVAAALVSWLASVGCSKVGMNAALAAFRAVAEDFERYDPFLELYPEALLSADEAQAELAKLKPRLDTWLCTHFGCRDKEYVRLVAAKTLIAAVARAVKPGAQVDTMLVLQGEQGIGKTQVLRTLGSVIPQGYQELLDMRDKDSLLTMHDGLIVEVSELRALRYAQEETSKAFFTRTRDRIRAPYARSSQDFDRRIVFVGTTNDPEFLSDHQNRRYWPVACATIARMSAKQAHKLWREAALRYAAGEQWWLSGNEELLQKRVVANFRDVDIIEERLSTWLRGKDKISLNDTMSALFDDRATQVGNVKRVTRALHALGWRSRMVGKARRRVWVLERRERQE